MVFLFIKTIRNIFSNYIPHETVTCDIIYPPWINNKIKKLIKEKNDTCKSYILNDKNHQVFHKIKYLQNQLRSLIERSQGLLVNIKKVVKPQKKSLFQITNM